MAPSVKEVIPGADYVLSVRFDNGESGSLDMKDVLEFGVFTRIRDPDAFRRVRVSFDTIAWDCGVDLDPEYVYAKCTRNVESAPPQGHAPHARGADDA
jgi:hypothetical protein